jgi:DNA-binding GntR family transcriptional regulator
MSRYAGRLIAELEALASAMREAIRKKQTAQYREFDAQFHRAFFRHCGNSYLAAMYSMMEAKLQTLRVSLITPLPHLLNVSLEEHVKIAKSLHDSKVDVALRVLTEHIKRARELMRGLHEVAPITVEKLS